MENQDATTALIENKARIDALLKMRRRGRIPASEVSAFLSFHRYQSPSVRDAGHWTELLEDNARGSGPEGT